MKLTETDKKKIKLEKRIGFVYGYIVAMTGIIALFLTLYRNDFTWPLLKMILMPIFIAVVSVLVSAIMNRKYNKDLKEGKRVVKPGVVQLKEEEEDHEPGSGALYIPILGELFPKIWGQKMKKVQRYNLIIHNNRFPVSKELFDSVEEGYTVTMYYPACSDTLLGIEK